jgi:hypothetical protein
VCSEEVNWLDLTLVSVQLQDELKNERRRWAVQETFRDPL